MAELEGSVAAIEAKHADTEAERSRLAQEAEAHVASKSELETQLQATTSKTSSVEAEKADLETKLEAAVEASKTQVRVTPSFSIRWC